MFEQVTGEEKAMRAVLVILLIAGIASLALGLILVNGAQSEATNSNTHTLTSESGSTEICLTCHHFDTLDWSDADLLMNLQGTIVEPASVLRGSATIRAPLADTPQAPESDRNEKTAEAESDRLP
jgi:hypothetical protein